MNVGRLFGLALLCAAIQASAHDDLQGTRYVAVSGLDEGECDNTHAPCQTIAYALSTGLPGSTVKLAEGLFSIEGLDVDEILHGKAGLQGGFRVADGFAHQDLDNTLTQVYGAPPFLRTQLSARGMQLIVDEVALHRLLRGEYADAARTFRASILRAQVPSECVQGSAGQFPCRNVDFAGRMALTDFSSRPGSMSNLWGFVDRNDNREYAVVGLSNGTAVVDVTNPGAPREVGTVPGVSSPWREVKIYQFFDTGANRFRAYAYVSTEAVQGMQVIDLSALPDTVALANTIGDYQTSHTLHMSNVDYASNTVIPGREAFLYIAGSNRSTGSHRGSFLVYDLDDPATPRLVTEAPADASYMHDSATLYLTDNRTAQCGQGHNPCEVLVDFNESTIDLWDVTDKSQPVRLSATGYPTARYTHSGWPTPDQRAIFVHDELDELRIAGFNTHIYTLEIDDLLAPSLVTSYTGPTTTTDHNGYSVGNRYYVAHYRRGLVVFDATNPQALREVGNFDTFLAPAENVAGTQGAWGVYPFLPSGTLLVNDIDNGLFVLSDATRNLALNPGRLGFTTASMTQAEAAGSVVVTVRRTRGVQGAVSIQYATRDGTATSGNDYTATSGTLTWNAGNDDDRTLIIPIANDSRAESDETLELVLSAPSGGATIDAASQLTITLQNDDGSAGGGGGGFVTVPMSLVLSLLLGRRTRVRYLAAARVAGRGAAPSRGRGQNRKTAEAVRNQASSTLSTS